MNDNMRRMYKVGVAIAMIVGLGLIFLSISVYAPAQMGDVAEERLKSRLSELQSESLEAGIELGLTELRFVKYWELYQELESLKQKKIKSKNGAEYIMSQTTIIGLQLDILREAKNEN